MLQPIKKIAFSFLVCSSLHAAAQTGGKDFTEVDAYVKKLGPLDSMNMGTISEKLTAPFSDKMEKARAIYDWIANNIAYDVKMARSGNISKNSSTEVLLYRKAVGIGFATLFQDMCSSADIRCLTADGFIKNTIEDIGEKQSEINHSWDVVQLGQSPDKWFYVDAAFASGAADATGKLFVKSFTSGYFFADKQLFNWQHFPDNEAWKLGPAPKSKAEFLPLPIIKNAAFDVELNKFFPAQGMVKAALNKDVAFKFSFGNGIADVSKVSIVYGEARKLRTKEPQFNYSGNSLSFNFRFDTEGDYPVTVLVNGKELITYHFVVEEP